MEIRKYLLLLIISLSSWYTYAQVAQVEKLGQITESNISGRIEPTGRFSFIDDNNIVYSDDEGTTWEEIQIPDNLVGAVSYRGLETGNYIVYTEDEIYYQQNGEWKLLSIEGDSTFEEDPFVFRDKVLLVQNDTLYAYDDITKSTSTLVPFGTFGNSFDVKVFNNYVAVEFDRDFYFLFSYDLEPVGGIEKGFAESFHITEEGYFIKRYLTGYESNEGSEWGNRFEISTNGGQSYTVLVESQDEEYHIVGEIDGRLYFRGFITQSEAWTSGHLQSRMGYIDLSTGEIVEVQDGINSTYNNLPQVAGGNLYHNIKGAIVKYPEGDLSQRETIFQDFNATTQPIIKIRETQDGTTYALSPRFLYKSINQGQDWTNILDYHSVIDFDIDEDGNLYCISNDEILKSIDQGQTFESFSRLYDNGFIDAPNEIISMGQNRLMVKGIANRFPFPDFPLYCNDCFKHYPELIFTTNDDGDTWTPKYVSENFSFDGWYPFPVSRSIQSENFVQTQTDLYTFDRGNYSITDKTTFDFQNTFLGGSDEIKYGISREGHLIKNEEGLVSYSLDSGLSFNDLSQTNFGTPYPGSQTESLYVISSDSSSFGSLSYQVDYDTPFEALTVQLEETGETIVAPFDRVYATSDAEFLFSEACTYRVKSYSPPADPLSASATLVNDILCHGGASASVSVEVFGGTPPFQYTLNENTQDSNLFENLAAGNHEFVIRDANEQEFTTNIQINEPEAIVLETIVEEDTVTLNASGGTPPFQYSIDGNTFQSKNQFSNLLNGDYTMIVRDANGCTTSDDININVIPPLLVDIIVTEILDCTGLTAGSIETSGVGGLPPYEYSLDGGPFQESGLFTNVSPGEHEVVIRDANMSIISNLVSLSAPSPLEVDININDNDIDIEVMGGTAPFTYSLDGGLSFSNENTFVDLEPGDYEIIVEDTNACTITQIFSIISTSTIQIDQSLIFSLYPNPAKGSTSLTLDANAAAQDIQISLVDILGRTVREYNNNHRNGNQYELDIHNVVPGTYLIRVDIGGLTAIKKLVVQ